jgi:hypothetical protein
MSQEDLLFRMTAARWVPSISSLDMVLTSIASD